MPASPVGLDPTCPPRFTDPLPSFFYFSLASSVFRKGYPVRNSIFQVFTTFVPCLHFLSVLNRFVCPALQGLYRLFTFRSCRSFSAKTFLSEIPSPRSLQSLSHANITISPKTDLSENLSRPRVVFPADLLLLLHILSLSRCFRFLISHVPSFLLYCKMQIISFSASPVLFSFPLLSLSEKIILSVSPLHDLYRLFLLFACFVRFS